MYGTRPYQWSDLRGYPDHGKAALLIVRRCDRTLFLTPGDVRSCRVAVDHGNADRLLRKIKAALELAYLDLRQDCEEVGEIVGLRQNLTVLRFEVPRSVL